MPISPLATVTTQPPSLAISHSLLVSLRENKKREKKVWNLKKKGNRGDKKPSLLRETQLHADFRRSGRRCSQTHRTEQLINNGLITPVFITGEIDSPSTPPEPLRVGTVGKVCPNPPLKTLRCAFFSLGFLSLFSPPARPAESSQRQPAAFPVTALQNKSQVDFLFKKVPMSH